MQFLFNRIPIVLLITLSLFTSCISSKKVDRFVAYQYNGQVPKLNKKTIADVTITSALPSAIDDISSTVKKTSKVLPLIFYWQYDYRHTTTLNPAIPVNNFNNAFHKIANKELSQKLNGRKLQLTVENIPDTYALVDKGHIVWVVYAITWNKIYMEPDKKDLVVAYQLLENDKATKTGRITIQGTMQNQNVQFFQSWKSATSDYLANYNIEINNMTKSFVSKLLEEL